MSPHVTSRPVGALHWIPFQLEIIHLFGLQNLLSSQPEGPLLGGPLDMCWSWICATVELEKHGDMVYEIWAMVTSISLGIPHDMGYINGSWPTHLAIMNGFPHSGYTLIHLV